MCLTSRRTREVHIVRRLGRAGSAGMLLVGAFPAAVAAAEGGAIDSGNTAWLLVATALVMVMLPGLALFYGGLVRSKNVLSTIMHSFFGLALVSVVWVLVGFSLAFGVRRSAGSGLIGGLDYRRLHERRPRAAARSTRRRSRSCCSRRSS